LGCYAGGRRMLASEHGDDGCEKASNVAAADVSQLMDDSALLI